MKITSVPNLPQGSGVMPSNQTNTNEPPKPVVPAVKEEPKVEGDQLSQKYADWAKKEKLFRSKVQAREEALKQREEAMKAKEAEYTQNYIQKSKIPELFQRDSQKALQELGLSGDTLTQALLNQPSPQDLKIQELEAKLATLTGLPDQTKNLFEERDKRAYDAAITQIRTDVQSLVSEDSSFEVIKGTQSEDEVVSLIKKTFDEEGKLLSIQEAAKIVEDSLVTEMTKFLQMEKIKQKLQPAAPVETTAPVAKQAPARTLAHSQVAPAQRPMNARERAILAFEGKL